MTGKPSDIAAVNRQQEEQRQQQKQKELQLLQEQQQQQQQIVIVQPVQDFTVKVSPELVPSTYRSSNSLALQHVDKTIKREEMEITDEVTVETRVLEVKTLKMELSGSTGGVSLSETTEVQTNTGLQEQRKSREREETIITQRMLDRPLSSSSTPPHTPLTSLRALPAPDSSFISDTISIEEEVPIFVAISSYEPEADDVLSLHEGEKLEVLDDTDDDWWRARKIFNQKEGFVPGKYLQDKEEYDQLIEAQLSEQVDKLPSDPCKIPTVSFRSYLVDPN